MDPVVARQTDTLFMAHDVGPPTRFKGFYPPARNSKSFLRNSKSSLLPLANPKHAVAPGLRTGRGTIPPEAENLPPLPRMPLPLPIPLPPLPQLESRIVAHLQAREQQHAAVSALPASRRIMRDREEGLSAAPQQQDVAKPAAHLPLPASRDAFTLYQEHADPTLLYLQRKAGRRAGFGRAKVPAQYLS